MDRRPWYATSKLNDRLSLTGWEFLCLMYGAVFLGVGTASWAPLGGHVGYALLGLALIFGPPLVRRSMRKARPAEPA